MVMAYIRKSSKDQNQARQDVLMERLEVDRVFSDTESGANRDRPGLNAMLAFIRTGDTVIVESISRLARNIRDLLEIVEKIESSGAELVSQKEQLDTTTPAGRFMFQMFGAIAELERSYLLERQREGIEIAKAKGVYKGRKPIDLPNWDAVHGLVCSGDISLAEGARQLGISRTTFYRRMKQFKATSTFETSEYQQCA